MPGGGPSSSTSQSGGDSDETDTSAPSPSSVLSLSLLVASSDVLPCDRARSNIVSARMNSPDSVYTPSPERSFSQKLEQMPWVSGYSPVTTDTLLTLVTDGIIERPIVRLPAAARPAKTGISHASRYSGSNPSMQTNMVGALMATPC